MKTRVQAHACYKLSYHVVWIPKYRKKLFIKGIAKYTEEVLKSVATDRYPDVEIEELFVMPDHVHMMISIPPKYPIATIIGYIKGRSAKQLNQKFNYLSVGRDNLWSIGYFVSSVGLNEQTIRNYIQNQEKQDKGQLIAVWDKETTGFSP